MRNESSLKSALLARIKADLPGFVPLRHEDVRTCGIPDLSLTGLARTSWWECKHASPTFDSTGIQELTMLRLAAAGHARYIVWEEKRGVKRTLVIHPKHLSVYEKLYEASLPGHDMRELVDYMARTGHKR